MTRDQAAMHSDALLVADHLKVRYRNGAIGIADVGFTVARGQVVALFGPNGAGKTTCVRAVSGFLKTEGARIIGGRATFLGADITNVEPHKTHASGLSTVPERRKVFATLTVEENLLAVGRLPPRQRREEVFDRLYGIFPALAERRATLAGRLSGGQQQMLAIARALVCEPKLLIVDEMTLGLHHSLHEPLFSAVRSIAAEGTSVVVVDESTGFALDVADYCYLLTGGIVRDEGPASRFRGNELLAAGYVEEDTKGLEHVRPVRPTAVASLQPSLDSAKRRQDAGGTSASADSTVLSVRDLSISFGGVHALMGVTAELQRGEVAAIVGPNGAGKTTLLNAISGLLNRNISGQVSLSGRDIHGWHPAKVAAAGVARSFQNPPLIEDETVMENLLLGAHLRLGYGAVSQLFRRREVGRREADRTRIALELLDYVGLVGYAKKPAGTLSYGGRKLLDIIRGLLSSPTLLLLDEPTSGLDADERAVVQQLLLDLREHSDVSVLVVEHHMEIVRATAQKVIGLQAGKVLLVGRPDDVLDSESFRSAVVGTKTIPDVTQPERSAKDHHVAARER